MEGWRRKAVQSEGGVVVQAFGGLVGFLVVFFVAAQGCIVG